jgi:hypothetical protein
MFYSWAACGRDINAPPVAQGIADDLHQAQQCAAKFMLNRTALVAMVAECWPGGDVWYGMAAISGQEVIWRRRVQRVR